MKAPSHLRAATRKWWSSIADAYELEPHHLSLLTLAGEAWDRVQEAREVIAKHGAYIKLRSGNVKRHPALDVERDNRIAFARLVRELALDVDAPPDARPPRVGG